MRGAVWLAAELKEGRRRLVDVNSVRASLTKRNLAAPHGQKERIIVLYAHRPIMFDTLLLAFCPSFLDTTSAPDASVVRLVPLRSDSRGSKPVLNKQKLGWELPARLSGLELGH